MLSRKETSVLVTDSHQTNGLKVLLVEDSPIDARMILGLLQGPAEGLNCHHVTRLDQALKLLSSVYFDVVLLDLNLDDSVGYETFSSMHDAACGAAIIVLSGSDDEELAVRTVREGAQDYLVKGSFDARLLVRSIRYASERNRVEEALRRSEAAVRAIFDNSIDGILILAAENDTCVDANSAAYGLLGQTREELIGDTILHFADEGMNEEWRRLKESGSGRRRLWIRRPDGAKRLVDCGFIASILPERHLVVLRDVTEQQVLEEQLRQSQKMEAVGRLAGGVAHDFNNILGIITGYAELMQLNAADPPQRSRVEKILAATEKAASLTRQLLAFSRKQLISPKLLDIAAIVADMGAMLRCLTGAAIQVEVRAEEGAGMVRADQGQIEQVVLNLATNARDALIHGGVMTLRVENFTSHGEDAALPAGDYVCFSVTDNGIGMDADVQSRMFEPFFTTKKTGSGLGLSTVYGIVKQSGGYITARSAPDEGSTFSIYLPRVFEPRMRPSENGKPKGRDVMGTETILLVDDEEELRNAAAEYLEGCGYRVLEAKNGAEAIDLVSHYEGEIAVLISDIVMPKVGGRGLVDYVRKTRPNTGILVISGYADDAVMRHGIYLETTCFLQKPFTFQNLGQKIRTLLDTAR